MTMTNAMTKMMKWLAISIICFTAATPMFAGDGVISFDSPRWDIKAATYRMEDYKGQKSLFLHGGYATIKDLDFTDGIIEFDVAFSKGRGFFGAVFRVQNDHDYEEFYLRSHQSGNPDAIQYTPVYNGMSAWQLYHGKGFGAAAAYEFDTWLHVKLIVSGNTAELYVGNNKEKPGPVLFMHHLKRKIKAGKVGLKVNRFAPCRFANFSVTPMKNPPMQNKPLPQEKIEPGTVEAWAISSGFNEAAVHKALRLTAELKKDLKWKKLESETSGLANISKLVQLKRPNNTVFARIVITSAKDQLKKLKFGYSDRVRVYFNDRLLYSGNNNYRSRDYRYLGTIGYFDEIVLPLSKGKNELWLAVSENFGGWGLKAKFDDMEGIHIKH